MCNRDLYQAEQVWLILFCLFQYFYQRAIRFPWHKMLHCPLQFLNQIRCHALYLNHIYVVQKMILKVLIHQVCFSIHYFFLFTIRIKKFFLLSIISLSFSDLTWFVFENQQCFENENEQQLEKFSFNRIFFEHLFIRKVSWYLAIKFNRWNI